MELIAASCYLEYVHIEIKREGSQDFSSKIAQLMKQNYRNDNGHQSWFWECARQATRLSLVESFAAADKTDRRSFLPYSFSYSSSSSSLFQCADHHHHHYFNALIIIYDHNHSPHHNKSFNHHLSHNQFQLQYFKLQICCRKSRNLG